MAHASQDVPSELHAEESPSSDNHEGRRSLLRFLLPQTTLIAGATQCGKTHFIKRLLLEANGMFDPLPVSVLYCYSAWQPSYNEIENAWGQNIEFTSSLPTKDDLLLRSTDFRHQLLIIDDKMSELNSRDIVDIVCVLCHHRNISVFIVVQNMFHTGAYIRDISLNVQSIVLFKNPRSMRQISTLAGQMAPGRTDFVLDSYRRATAPPYGYLLIDLNPRSPSDRYQFRTNIFPGEDTIVYLPK